VEGLNTFPNVVVVFDSIRDKLSLREAKRLKITTVGVCDTNADPDLLTYPMPGNDDAVKSLKFFIDRVTEAILDGKRLFEGRTPVKLKEEASSQTINQRASQPETPVV
jgi:small subunit ribosomal protein S2